VNFGTATSARWAQAPPLIQGHCQIWFTPSSWKMDQNCRARDLYSDYPSDMGPYPQAYPMGSSHGAVPPHMPPFPMGNTQAGAAPNLVHNQTGSLQASVAPNTVRNQMGPWQAHPSSSNEQQIWTRIQQMEKKNRWLMEDRDRQANRYPAASIPYGQTVIRTPTDLAMHRMIPRQASGRISRLPRSCSV
jgi:hypothetical protein